MSEVSQQLGVAPKKSGAPKPSNAAPKQRAPTLYAIIGFKLLKGLLFLTIAAAIFLTAHNNLPGEYHAVLEKLNHHTRFFNPEKEVWVNLAKKVDGITVKAMVRVAIGTFCYSLFSLVESIGLMLRISWAGWLSIGESAFFIPIEVYEMIEKYHRLHRFSPIMFVIMIANVIILWYLFQNRARLFRHHH